MPSRLVQWISPRKWWRRSPFWLNVIGGGSLVVLVSAAGAWWSTSGSFPDWLEAVATAAALIAAVFAARYAANTFVIEVKRDKARVAAAERAQAESIAVWIEDALADRVGAREQDWKLVLYNASSLPVYSARWSIHGQALDGAERVVGLLPLLTPGRKDVDLDPIDGMRFRYVDEDGDENETHEVMGYDFSAALSFRDAAGRVWRRDQAGRLMPPAE